MVFKEFLVNLSEVVLLLNHYQHYFVSVSTAVRNQVQVAHLRTRNIGKKIESEIKKRSVIRKKSAAKKNTVQVQAKKKIDTALTSTDQIKRNTVAAQARTKIRRGIVQRRKINTRKRRNLELKIRRTIIKLRKK